MQDAVIAARFNESLRTQVKLWINQREMMIWAYADWPFKKVSKTLVDVSAAGVVTPTPADFHRGIWMETTSGNKVEPLSQREWRTIRPASSANQATATEPTWWSANVDQSISIYPVGASQVYLAYERKLAHYNNSAAITTGAMSADTDYPMWDATFHTYLVWGAIATGLKRENDPTWAALEDDFSTGMLMMSEYYLPPNEGVENRQFDRIADW